MYLINLKIKNAYSHLDTDVHFEDGLNWLLGENEGGKTELLDMIGYALFGAGLRSKITEYKGLDVELVFRINDEILKVIRGKTTSIFKVSYDSSVIKEDKIATGKTATNSAIVDRLGYNYNVYSKLNYSKQLEGIALTSAKTSERLSLINSINGVDEANAFEKTLESIKKELKSQLKVLDTGSILDTLDFEIEDDLDSLATEEYILSLTNKSIDLYSNIKEISAINMYYSAIPTEPFFQGSSMFDDLFSHYGSIDLLSQWISFQLLNISIIKDAKERLEVIEIELKDLYNKKLNIHASEKDLVDYDNSILNNKKFYEQEKLLAEHSVTCPKCEHVFTELGLTNTYSLMSVKLTEQEYKEASIFNEKHKARITYLEQAAKENKLSLEKSFKEQPQLLSSYTEEALLALQKEIQVYRQYQYQLKIYQDKLHFFCNKFNCSVADLPSFAAKISNLEKLEKEISDTSTLKDCLTTYASKKSVYTLALKTQSKIDKDIELLKEKLEIIDQVLLSSKDKRLEIQNNCIPVLNNLASKMINKLTGGKRYGLTMNNTFELTLDGKPIESYSGSTIVLANVAFRIALIEMFFKKSFPVFIGDEIDAYADDNRAQHIHDALVKLEQEGYQLILVSHHALNFKGNKIQLADIKKTLSAKK